MRTLRVFLKSLREQLREPLVLSLTLIFGPFFVLLYSLFFNGGSTSYQVILHSRDLGVLQDGVRTYASADLAEALAAVRYADGSPMLALRWESDLAKAEDDLLERKAVVLLEIDELFSAAFQPGVDEPVQSTLTFVGDLTNPYYAVAVVMASAGVESFLSGIGGEPGPLLYAERALGGSAARSEFEIYVPGLLIFSIIMLVFQAAMVLTREVEAGTLGRLQLTPLRSGELLGGTALALALVGLAGALLSYLTAIALGYTHLGSPGLVLLIYALTSVAVVGSGLIVAAFSKTVSQAFILANFPLAFFMFFSGVIYPVPAVALFGLGGRAISLYDLLPTTHAVQALSKVLTMGLGVEALGYELGGLLLLSGLYFAAGVWLFQRRQINLAG